MTCDQAKELTPKFPSLSVTEQAAVLAHTEKCRKCRKRVRRNAHREMKDLPPEIIAWVMYQGRLMEERISQQQAIDPECPR